MVLISSHLLRELKSLSVIFGGLGKNPLIEQYYYERSAENHGYCIDQLKGYPKF